MSASQVAKVTGTLHYANKVPVLGVWSSFFKVPVLKPSGAAPYSFPQSLLEGAIPLEVPRVQPPKHHMVDVICFTWPRPPPREFPQVRCPGMRVGKGSKGEKSLPPGKDRAS